MPPTMHESHHYLPDLRTGLYVHFKGGRYLVLGYGHDANDAARTVVVYVGFGHELELGLELQVRTATDFLAQVCNQESHEDFGRVPKGEKVCTVVPRFRYAGPALIGHVHDDQKRLR